MRTWIKQGIKILISSLLIWILLKKIGIGTLYESLRQVHPLWFAAALILFTASHFLGSYQWWRMMRAESVHIPFRKTVPIYFTGLFFNNFLIGGMGGDVWRIMDVRRLTGKGTVAVSTVFMDRVMGLLVLSSLAIVTSPYLMISGIQNRSLRWIYPILGVAWTLILCFFFIRRFARLFSRVIIKIMPKDSHLKVRDIYDRIYAFGRQRRLFMEVVIISIGVQSARILMHYLLALSLGWSISPMYFFLFVPIIAILASLPISLGGIGLREQSGVLLFAVTGMAATDAFTMEFLAFIVAVISSLPGGVWFIFRNGRKIRKI